MANMNSATAPASRPLRMFLRASLRVIIGGGAFYSRVSATIVANSRAR